MSLAANLNKDLFQDIVIGTYATFEKPLAFICGLSDTVPSLVTLSPH